MDQCLRKGSVNNWLNFCFVYQLYMFRRYRGQVFKLVDEMKLELIASIVDGKINF